MNPYTTCILQKPTQTQSGIDVTTTWVDYGKPFLGMLQSLSMQERTNPFNKETVFATYRLFIFARDLNDAIHDLSELREKNRIRISTIVYDIQAVHPYFGIHYEVELLEVT